MPATCHIYHNTTCLNASTTMPASTTSTTMLHASRHLPQCCMPQCLLHATRPCQMPRLWEYCEILIRSRCMWGKILYECEGNRMRACWAPQARRAARAHSVTFADIQNVICIDLFPPILRPSFRTCFETEYPHIHMRICGHSVKCYYALFCAI